MLDPFPALRALAEMPVEPPAVVFWSGLGATCCLSLKDAQEFFRRDIRDNLAAGKGVIHRLVEARANEAGTKHLLHISDLHFGDATSDSSRQYIKSHLDRILSSIDRVVVTGDLFNSPQSAYLDQYLDFKSDVERMTKKPLIVIPGNHDVRPKGNVIPWILKSNYEFAQKRALGARVDPHPTTTIPWPESNGHSSRNWILSRARPVSPQRPSE